MSEGQVQQEDDDILAELEREVEELNEADAEDAAEFTGGRGRGDGDELSAAFRDYREKRLAEIREACVCGLENH